MGVGNTRSGIGCTSCLPSSLTPLNPQGPPGDLRTMVRRHLPPVVGGDLATQMPFGYQLTVMCVPVIFNESRQRPSGSKA